MSNRDDDGYGRYWDYRVFSSMWTEPDVWESGKRFLTVHRVDYVSHIRGRALLGTHDYPIAPDDLIHIEAEPASPEGCGMEAALLDAERIMRAFDKPALIKAEWQGHFDHSEKQHRKWEAERLSKSPLADDDTAN